MKERGGLIISRGLRGGRSGAFEGNTGIHFTSDATRCDSKQGKNVSYRGEISSQFLLSAKPPTIQVRGMILIRRQICSPGCIWQDLEIFFIIPTGKGFSWHPMGKCQGCC